MKIKAEVQIVFATCYPQANLDTSNHTLVKEVAEDSVEMILEKTFMLQGNNPEASKYWGDEFYSLSVGDTVWLTIEGQKDSLHIVCPMGFCKMTGHEAIKWDVSKPEDRYWIGRDMGKTKDKQDHDQISPLIWSTDK